MPGAIFSALVQSWTCSSYLPFPNISMMPCPSREATRTPIAATPLEYNPRCAVSLLQQLGFLTCVLLVSHGHDSFVPTGARLIRIRVDPLH